MKSILASKDMTDEEKIQKLRGLLDKPAYWPGAYSCIERLDKLEAYRIALGLFRAEDTSRERKLELGRILVRGRESISSAEMPPFMPEYASFLVDAVLNGGADEFCAKREERRPSAVGEYALIASGYAGHSASDFKYIKDRRVIPTLIKCLDAPDHVHGQPQGCAVFGKPGESTGRNGQRQQIPIALARLEATEAIPRLKRVLLRHHDRYLRHNAAYALALLMGREESKILEHELKRSEEFRDFLFPFGQGLIERDYDDGIEYMAFDYSRRHPGSKRPESVLYMASERLRILHGLKSDRTAAFYREVLEYGPLYDILVFDSEKVDFRPSLLVECRDAEEALGRVKWKIVAAYQKIIAGIQTNALRELLPLVLRIGEETRDPDIRTMSEECARHFEGLAAGGEGPLSERQ